MIFITWQITYVIKTINFSIRRIIKQSACRDRLLHLPTTNVNIFEFSQSIPSLS